MLDEKPDKAIAYMVDVRGTIDARMHDIRTALLGDVDNLLAPLQAAYTTLETRVSEIQTEVQNLVANPAATLADQATLRELTNQVRALRVDVNTLMEGQPAGAGPSTSAANDNRFERVNNRLVRVEEAEQRLQSLLTTLEVRVEDITAGEAGLSAPLATQRPEVVPPVSTQEAQNVQVQGRREEPREAPRAEHRRSRRNESRERRNSDRESNRDETPGHSSDDDDRRYRRGETRGGVFARRRGSSYPHLEVIRPTNRDYRTLVDYRQYRLRDERNVRTGRETTKTKDHISRLALVLQDLKFDGTDEIMILHFLARFVTEADTLEMSEGQAYLALPHFLRGMAEAEFRSTADTPVGGVTCWPEAVNYLLRSYATNEAIQTALLALRDVRQRDGETELDYNTRLNKAERRCGNPHTVEDRITIFIDGLTPAVKPLVYRYREENPSATYLQVLQKARAEGEARRAATPQRRASPLLSPRKLSPQVRQPALRRPGRDRRSNLLLEDTHSPPMSGDIVRSLENDYDNVHYMDEHSTSMPSTEFVTAEGTEPPQEDSLLAFERARNRTVRPAHVPYSEYDHTTRHSRPGWVDRRSGYGPTEGRRPPKIICHICYRVGHTAPDCILTVREMFRIVANYEALEEEERSRVPASSYWRAKNQYVPDGRGHKPAATPGDPREQQRGSQPREERPRSPSPVPRPPTPGPGN